MGQKRIETAKTVLSYLQTPSDSPELESKRHTRKFDKGVCIFDTLAPLKWEFDMRLIYLLPEAAVNPGSLLEFFDS